MLDEGNTDALGSERLRTLYEDGRLIWTVTEAAKLLGISPDECLRGGPPG
jgi:hypothetical protein